MAYPYIGFNRRVHIPVYYTVLSIIKKKNARARCCNNSPRWYARHVNARKASFSSPLIRVLVAIIDVQRVDHKERRKRGAKAKQKRRSVLVGCRVCSPSIDARCSFFNFLATVMIDSTTIPVFILDRIVRSQDDALSTSLLASHLPTCTRVLVVRESRYSHSECFSLL